MDESAITRHTLEVPRFARYHRLGTPTAATRALEFVLHGYGQLAGPFLESARARATPQRVLVAPEGLSRYYLRRGTGEVGASWMTKEERALEIVDTVRYLDRVAAEVASDELELTLLGFSQGAAAAARWALLGQTVFARVSLLGCPLPPDLELAAHAPRVRALGWTFVLGLEDTTVERGALERDLERLRALGASAELRTFAGGHALEPGLLAELA